MKRYLIFGTGSASSRNYKLVSRIPALNDCKIVGFLDNNSSKWNTEFEGVKVFSPNEIKNLEYDYICIWSSFENEIREQLKRDFNIGEDKIKNIFQPFYEQLIDKYKDTDDEEIKVYLEKISNKSYLNMFYFEEAIPEKKYEVYIDNDNGFPYVVFENKRMYLKKDYPMILKNGKRYASDFWYEQDVNSPHLYESGKIVVKDGDILVDAGVCEGNFSLHNIDKVSKVYLIECDTDWMEALKLTFEPYKDKVVFCDKFLSDETTEEKITIDDLVNEDENVGFLKMDIEGEEIKALKGAKRILREGLDIRMSICSYHKTGDKDGIIEILNKNNINTECSNGYMLFFDDDDLLKNPELRRGIVRGYRCGDDF